MRHGAELPLERCPHCNVAKPRLPRVWSQETQNYRGSGKRQWSAYACGTCGGVVLASAPSAPNNAEINAMWPAPQSVADELPERAREYLQQATASIHAPAGAVVVAASAVDAMLKSKNYREGSLYSRIDKAAADHVITTEMAAWAHEVRLDANDQRHADESAPLPTEDDARRVIDFAMALGQFMFVLPKRVEQGRRRGGSTAVDA